MISSHNLKRVIKIANKQSEKSVATKKKLVDAAQKLFCKKGFEKTTVREIVEAAGVAQGTFYLYFVTKDKILFEILHDTFESFNSYFAKLNIENPELDDIDYIIDIVVLYMKNNPDIIRLLHDANIIDIMGFEKYDAIAKWFMISLLEKWLENANHKGIIVTKSPILYSKILFQISHELLESAFLYEFPEKIDVVKEEVKQIIKNILM